MPFSWAAVSSCSCVPWNRTRILRAGQMQMCLFSVWDIVPGPQVQSGDITLNTALFALKTALFALNTGAGLPAALSASACHHPLVMGGPQASSPSPVEKMMGSPSKFSPLLLLCLKGLLGCTQVPSPTSWAGVRLSCTETCL